MASLIVLLSGRVCTGKSTLAENLRDRFGLVHCSTRTFLKTRNESIALERGVMQDYGEQLDTKTRGAWVRDELARQIESLPPDAAIVVDSVRARSQIDRIRESYRPIVVHVHLDCDEAVLEKRYKKRRNQNLKELKSFWDTLKNRTEKEVPNLKIDADVCIRTDRCTDADVLTRVACHLGFHGRGYPQHVDVIVGGQYGSEGKGQIAAYLAREYDLLVRVGGPNAGHKVFEEETPYTFHQLPSGTRRSEADLLIGPGAAINVDILLREIAECGVDCQRLAIDPLAVIITDRDKQWEMKNLRETIGSTAQGVGRAAVRRIERRSNIGFAKDVHSLGPYLRPAIEVLDEARVKGRRVMLEGTQGTGLSIYHGNYPHVTSRDTTVAGCLSETGRAPRSVRRILMVCRTYPIRVQSPQRGDSGPMSQELKLRDIHKRSGVALTELTKTEITSTTKRKRRIAEFDWTLLRKAASLNSPTDIALTFADYLDVRNRIARRFDQLTPDTHLFIQEIERVSSAFVSLLGVGFNHRTVLDRRHW